MKTIVCMLYKYIYIFTNTYEYYELPGWLQLDPWDKPHLRCLRTSLIPTKEKSGWGGRCGTFGSFWKRRRRRLREGDANTPGPRSPRSQSSGKSGISA